MSRKKEAIRFTCYAHVAATSGISLWSFSRIVKQMLCTDKFYTGEVRKVLEIYRRAECFTLVAHSNFVCVLNDLASRMVLSRRGLRYSCMLKRPMQFCIV